MRTKMSLMILILTALLISACEREGPAERAGKAIDDATEEVRDAAGDAADDLANAAEDACEDAKDAAGAEDTDC